MSVPDIYLFDLFGTLVDVSALDGAVAEFASDPGVFVTAWRQKQVAYMFAATLMERYVDFETITANAFDYTTRARGLEPSVTARARALGMWGQLPAFGDAVATVAALRGRGARVGVLSNGTPAGLASTLAGNGLAAHVDAVLSVDSVRKYKPHPAVYALATQHFAATPDQIAFVSSNGWDATGAAEFGFRVMWCNRAGLPYETLGRKPYRTIATLGDLLAG